MAGLRDGLTPGRTERELGDCIEHAYVADGGTNVIHYLGVTPMHAPFPGTITLSDRPGIGFEGQAKLNAVMRELAA